MNFKCANCNHDHHIKRDSYFLKPQTGTIVQDGWFKDKKGLQFYATACLKCGTVHATYGAALKSLFGRPLNIEKHFTHSQIEAASTSLKNKTAIESFRDFNIPIKVVEALQERGFLQFLKVDDSIEDWFIYMYEEEPSGVADDEEKREYLIECVKDFANQYVKACLTVSKNPNTETTFGEYLQVVIPKDSEPKNMQIVHFFEAIGSRYISHPQMMEIFKNAIDSYGQVAISPKYENTDFKDSLFLRL